MTAEQALRAYRLVQAIRKAAPPAPAASAAEMLRMEGSLAEFFRGAWGVLEPGKPLLWSWHYELLCEHLELVAARRLRRLIINVPPRTAKSTLATICFPVWTWLRDPARSFLFASYSRDLSTDHSIARRNLIQSAWFQGMWADRFRLAADRNLTTQYSNDRTGGMFSTSTGSGAEGRGGDVAILDDPMSNQQALSDPERKAANDWVAQTLKQRLNDPATAAIVVIMQRLHEADTTGFVQSEDPGQWTKVEVPLVAEDRTEYVFPSGRVHARERGDVLQPERFSPEIVEEKKRARLVFAGQYQQRPAPLEGNLIKRREVRYYGGTDPATGERDPELPEKFDKGAISVDCAFKDLRTSDYVAIGVVGVKGRKRYVLDVVNEHLDCQATADEIKRLRKAWSHRLFISAVYVEDKANGAAVVQKLRETETGIVEVDPQGGKVARMFAAAPEWQAGDWHVARNAAWAEPFVQQITMFPMAAHDDMADMMSQAAIKLGGGASMETWAKLGRAS